MTTPAPDGPVHRFRPTSGTIAGWLGVGLAVVVAAVTLVSEPTVVGLTVALGAALVGLLSWIVLLRPRVTAYAETLVLRNALSDLHLPLAAVDTVVVRHALNVWVGDRRYVCPAIGRSSRSMLRQRHRGPGTVMGAASVSGVGASVVDGDQQGTGGDYASFVEARIEELVRAARRDARGAEAGQVRREWARVELVALAVLTAAFLAALLLG